MERGFLDLQKQPGVKNFQLRDQPVQPGDIVANFLQPQVRYAIIRRQAELRASIKQIVLVQNERVISPAPHHLEYRQNLRRLPQRHAVNFDRIEGVLIH